MPRGHALRRRLDVYTPTGSDVHTHECACVSGSNQEKAIFSSSDIFESSDVFGFPEIWFIKPHRV